ncbi:hypothetical protein PM023_09460 [Halorubrum ezzemoulense]|uniref:hypothetical protein n=1 Tax=Halorubrum ezzemoulense TaxID=337243 RepID=UPI00232ED5E5|nr:hypothetical protein [Halorubrum ezzemoulense]MDB2224894.1 hypothetical protein [Halorubrum ezzemoulense]MDB2273163.1 hypothetical protein [Halorubrum ezzemoulense]
MSTDSEAPCHSHVGRRWSNGDGAPESAALTGLSVLAGTAVTAILCVGPRRLSRAANGFGDRSRDVASCLAAAPADREPVPGSGERYGWALAEGTGAAAALGERARDRGGDVAAERFRERRNRFVDCVDTHRGPAGPWYEKLSPAGSDGGPVPPEPPGVEPDYHPASAHFESWRSGVR